MRYLLFLVYFVSTLSFANHCSGEHSDDIRTDHSEESKQSSKMNDKDNEESSEVIEDSDKDT